MRVKFELLEQDRESEPRVIESTTLEGTPRIGESVFFSVQLTQDEWARFGGRVADVIWTVSRESFVTIRLQEEEQGMQIGATSTSQPSAGQDAPVPYTVLLLRPDYLADGSGHDTYQTTVTAMDAASASEAAQQEAMDRDGNQDGEPEDYHVLAVFRGEHDNLA